MDWGVRNIAISKEVSSWTPAKSWFHGRRTS